MSADSKVNNYKRRLQIALSGIQYTENADKNLKHLLIQAHEKLNSAKGLRDNKEYQAAVLSAKFRTSKVTKLSKIAKDILENSNLEEYKQDDIKLATDIFLPYLQANKIVDELQRQYDLIYERININQEIYNMYNQDAAEYRTLSE